MGFLTVGRKSSTLQKQFLNQPWGGPWNQPHYMALYMANLALKAKREKEEREKSNLRTAEVIEGTYIMEKFHNKMIAAYYNEAFLKCK